MRERVRERKEERERETDRDRQQTDRDRDMPMWLLCVGRSRLGKQSPINVLFLLGDLSEGNPCSFNLKDRLTKMPRRKSVTGFLFFFFFSCAV